MDQLSRSVRVASAIALLVLAGAGHGCAQREEAEPAATDAAREQPAGAPLATATAGGEGRADEGGDADMDEPTPDAAAGPRGRAGAGDALTDEQKAEEPESEDLPAIPTTPRPKPKPKLAAKPGDRPAEPGAAVPPPPPEQGKQAAERLSRPLRGQKETTGGEGDRREVLAETDAPKNMYFEHYGTNPTIDTEEEPRSTFAVDVDTASFTMARSFLDRGVMPSEAAIRVEEIVNAFDYGYEPPPSHGEQAKTFTVHAEAAPSPNRPGYHFLHIGVKGKEIGRAKRKAANLVFVIDVSGSMAASNRLGLVKQSLKLLVSQLGEADRVGIVTYGSSARQRLQPTSAHNKARILQVIEELKTEGATNAEAGLREGYAMAARHLRKDGGVNRVVLLSDGVANVGVTGPTGILETVKRQVAKGITLTSVGFGMGNYDDVLMEQLADEGNGNYHYVDRLSEAQRVFVDDLTGTLQVIAKDVKVQVDFDPRVVARYRLIGYENRVLSARQFDDDRVDAGELGAGHTVTALYEVRLVPGSTAALGKVRVRFKAPHGSQSQLMETSLSRSIVKSETGALSSPSQLSLAAAQFAEKLRGSYWARTVSYDEIARRLEGLAPALKSQSQVRELIRLVDKAEELDRRVDELQSQGPVARMDFDLVPVLQ
ncbi:MAG TPA: DUF3520 domain-containing protein [Polyangiaceae bacterium]|nr:DUF3520 domain-containing protein [Polyangiaceae bacterium]